MKRVLSDEKNEDDDWLAAHGGDGGVVTRERAGARVMQPVALQLYDAGWLGGTCARRKRSWHYAHMYTRARTHVHTRTHTCTRAHAHMYTRARTHVHARTHTCTRTHAHMYTHAPVSSNMTTTKLTFIRVTPPSTACIS